MSSKIISVQQMFQQLVRSDESRRAARIGGADSPPGPLFCFLTGAGFSINAGVPSTSDLVAALLSFEQQPGRSWHEILDELAADKSAVARIRQQAGPGEGYFQIISRVLPQRVSRHHFVTAAVQWAAERRPQICKESILLASILNAGTVDPDYPRLPEQAPGSRFAGVFAQHVFTTNFDEVLPTTYYLMNKPAEVVDRSGLLELSPIAEYPTIVYLHGRHLHYDLRNTTGELLDDEARRERGNLFDQFSSLISRCGLIVLGYSGAEDNVMRSISEALRRSRGESRGVYWGVNSSIERLDPAVRRLVEENDECYYFTPGLNAESLLTQICSELGIAHYAVVSRYWQKLSSAAETVRAYVEANPVELEDYLSELLKAYEQPRRERSAELLAAWDSRFSRFFEQYPDDMTRSRVLFYLAEINLAQGDARRAAQFLRDALELQLRLGDEQGAANNLNRQGDIAFWAGDCELARQAYSRALELHTRESRLDGAGYDLKGLGDVELWLGELSAAEQHYRRAAELHKGLDDHVGQGNALNGLGNVMLLRGELSASREYLGQALEVHRGCGDEHGAAIDLNSLGELEMLSGDFESALENQSQSHAICREVGDELGMAASGRGMGDALLALGRQDEAEARITAALAIHRQAGDELGIAHDELSLARLDLARGLDPQARLSRIAGVFVQRGDNPGRWEASRLRAKALELAGDTEAALKLLTEAEAEAKERGYGAKALQLQSDRAGLLPTP